MAYGFMVERPRETRVLLWLNNGHTIKGSLTGRGVYIPAEQLQPIMKITAGNYYDLGIERITIIDKPQIIWNQQYFS